MHLTPKEEKEINTIFHVTLAKTCLMGAVMQGEPIDFKSFCAPFVEEMDGRVSAEQFEAFYRPFFEQAVDELAKAVDGPGAIEALMAAESQADGYKGFSDRR